MRTAYCFFVESLDEPVLEPEVEPLPDDDWSVDELEPVDGEEDEDDGEDEDGEVVLPLPEDDDGEDDDGELVLPLPEDDDDGLLDGLLLLELDEPEDDGEDGEVMLPLLLPEPEVEPEPLLAPRSQAAIRLAPRARETATARVDNFILPP